MASCFCVRLGKETVKTLDFRHCNLHFVPSEIFEYDETLEELFLDSNDIRELPRDLFHCELLKKLGVSDNELVTVPTAVASLIHLEELDISKNGIVELPDNIKGCKSLRLVEVSVNPLGKLPEGFTQLMNLSHLYLNDTLLDYLPASFGRLTRLKVLELRENRLKALPKSISRLTELERLDLGQNSFREIPEVIGCLSKLTEVWIDTNKVTQLPQSFGNLSCLVYFDASCNRLEYLPAEMEKLESLTDLHLSKNFLHQLPENIGQLSNLATLKADNNQLASLPMSVGGLVSLEEFILSANDLEDLPPSIGLLRRLRHLNVDDNMLHSVPAELGSCSALTLLSLRGNYLKILPDEIGRISKLTVVNLSNNRLQSLPYSFTKLKNLQALWLSENQSKPLIPLQSEFIDEIGTRALTCFMFPQQPQDYEEDSYLSDGESFHQSVWEQERAKRSRIIFDVEDSEAEHHKNTARATTPYPKETIRPRFRMGVLAAPSNGHIPGKKLNLKDKVQSPRMELLPSKLSVDVNGVRRVRGRRELELDGIRIREAKVTRPKSPGSTISDSLSLFQADKEKRAKDKARIRRTSNADSDSEGQTSPNRKGFFKKSHLQKERSALKQNGSIKHDRQIDDVIDYGSIDRRQGSFVDGQRTEAVVHNERRRSDPTFDDQRKRSTENTRLDQGHAGVTGSIAFHGKRNSYQRRSGYGTDPELEELYHHSLEKERPRTQDYHSPVDHHGRSSRGSQRTLERQQRTPIRKPEAYDDRKGKWVDGIGYVKEETPKRVAEGNEETLQWAYPTFEANKGTGLTEQSKIEKRELTEEQRGGNYTRPKKATHSVELGRQALSNAVSERGDGHRKHIINGDLSTGNETQHELHWDISEILGSSSRTTGNLSTPASTPKKATSEQVERADNVEKPRTKDKGFISSTPENDKQGDKTGLVVKNGPGTQHPPERTNASSKQFLRNDASGTLTPSQYKQNENWRQEPDVNRKVLRGRSPVPHGVAQRSQTPKGELLCTYRSGKLSYPTNHDQSSTEEYFHQENMDFHNHNAMRNSEQTASLLSSQRDVNHNKSEDNRRMDIRYNDQERALDTRYHGQHTPVHNQQFRSTPTNEDYVDSQHPVEVNEDNWKQHLLVRLSKKNWTPGDTQQQTPVTVRRHGDDTKSTVQQRRLHVLRARMQNEKKSGDESYDEVFQSPLPSRLTGIKTQTHTPPYNAHHHPSHHQTEIQPSDQHDAYSITKDYSLHHHHHHHNQRPPAYSQESPSQTPRHAERDRRGPLPSYQHHKELSSNTRTKQHGKSPGEVIEHPTPDTSELPAQKPRQVEHIRRGPLPTYQHHKERYSTTHTKQQGKPPGEIINHPTPDTTESSAQKPRQAEHDRRGPLPSYHHHKERSSTTTQQQWKPSGEVIDYPTPDTTVSSAQNPWYDEHELRGGPTGHHDDWSLSTTCQQGKSSSHGMDDVDVAETRRGTPPGSSGSSTVGCNGRVFAPSPSLQRRLPPYHSPLPTRRADPDGRGGPNTIPVVIYKNPGLGFSITGGQNSPGNPFHPNDMGIFVTKVQPDGPADHWLFPGDKILNVNDQDFMDIDHEEAVQILKHSNPVSLVISRET